MELDRPWHHVLEHTVLEHFHVEIDRGLDPSEADARLERFGPNRLTPPRIESRWVVFGRQFAQPLVYVLLLAAALTAGLHEWDDMAVILGVVLLNAVIGYVQESKALQAILALSTVTEDVACVVRGGTTTTLPAWALVPGDIVKLSSGDRVPADVRLLRVRELRVQEAALTGESVPTDKHPDALPEDTSLADRANMAYASTLVTNGSSHAVVVATGDRSEIGKIQRLILGADVLATPLTLQIQAFSTALLRLILAITVVAIGISIVRGFSLRDALVGAVALAVGAIPEGLPAIITVTLAIGVSRMAASKALVRKLPAVETLGNTAIICSDKTGTLTRNEMTVQALVSHGVPYRVSGVGYAAEGDLLAPAGERVAVLPADVHTLLETGVLCNESSVRIVDGLWHAEGDPTEAALLVVARKAGLDPEAIAHRLPRLDALPFESERQLMAVLCDHGDDGLAVHVKGSLEAVLRRCDADPHTHAATDQALALAHEGLRVLAFARRDPSHDVHGLDDAALEQGFRFLGLQAMMDPPRPEAIEAVARCQAAGIRVKMITGDHVVTAQTIAHELGIHGELDAHGRLLGFTGRELEAMDDERFARAAERASVFARVSPEQKLTLVRALQQGGRVVAMTGDGVNDAPALRQANLGVAMGRSGTEVAKEAADMVLTDDNFATIVAAVEEGRGVHDNIVKSILWTLPTNLAEGLVILVALVAGSELPIEPLQILWVNMVSAGLLGLTLAFEPKEPRLMDRAPNDANAPLLGRDLLLRTTWVGLLLVVGTYVAFHFSRSMGASLVASRTAAVNVIVVAELFYLLNCRSLTEPLHRLAPFSNPWLVAGTAAMILAQGVFTYAPFMQHVFETAPLPWPPWALVVGIASVLAILVEIDKLRVRRKRKATRR